MDRVPDHTMAFLAHVKRLHAEVELEILTQKMKIGCWLQIATPSERSAFELGLLAAGLCSIK